MDPLRSPELPYKRYHAGQENGGCKKSRTLDHDTLRKVTALFAFLTELDTKFFRKNLKGLLAKCQEKGPEYLLTIKVLDLSHCELSQIPEEIGVLTQLKRLRLINNSLTSLPSSLKSLSRLQVVEVENNKLQKLPSVLRKLAEDRITRRQNFELFLRGNPIPTLPSAIKPVVTTLPHDGTIFQIERS